MKDSSKLAKLIGSRIVAAIVITLSIGLVRPGMAQVRPVNDYGALGLGQLLKRLQTNASVMMIGAHPDDEDSALLAYLARGENARTAYLSLTRGDGGQNIIGPELFESLGIIRTEELLQARRLDGAEQYFTRAFDYGFSKTLDEAKLKWPEKVILCDVVRAIRSFKPLVVISRFSGTPADGHGQHQYAGYISPISVNAAADASQCTESGTVWQVQKFYVEQGFSDTQAGLRINTGEFDELLGRSYFEIAMEGRSQHRSQGEGRLELRGDQFSGLRLVDSKATLPGKPETSIFEGLDIRPPVIIGQADLGNSSNVLILGKLLDSFRSKNAAGSEGSILTSAIRHALGIQIDALAERETVVPGETVGVGVKVYLHGLQNAKVERVTWSSPSDWQMTATDAPRENSSAFNRRESSDFAAYYTVKVPTSAKPTAPYWLESDRRGDVFEWPSDERQNLPFDPPILTAHILVSVNGKSILFDQPAEYRFADPARGEIRRELNVVPAMSVSLDQALLVVPAGPRPQKSKLVMTITNNTSGPVTGIATLNAEAASEWQVTSASPTVTLKSKGDKISIPIEVSIPGGTRRGTYELTASVKIGETRFDRDMQVISYPHIQTHRFYTSARTKVDVLDLAVSPVNVGYIMGSGDEVPEAIRQMGLNVTMIDDLATADLVKFDTVVVGIRASEVRPDLAANNQKLLDFVKNGGNLVVQYQRPTFVQQNLAPFPVNMTDTQRTAAGSTSRVVDENAKVAILEPTDPVFNFPNKITDDDFTGWIQERNAYNLVTFDKQYTPLLESHDAGEQPNNGGLVIAHLGKGTYIYTSYSWFRQLPSGVPGAYRIFANLLSLPHAARKNS